MGSIAAFEAWRNTHQLDVLIVDRQLPDGDGLQALASYRQVADTPAIVLTALGHLPERIAGMDADADYYLVKPVAMDEFIALLRRLRRRLRMADEHPWTIHPARWCLESPDGIEIPLTRRELALLELFVDQQGQVISRQSLAAGLGEQYETYDPRRLEIRVRRLRHKVEQATGKQLPLTTVYGLGFNFTLPLRKL